MRGPITLAVVAALALASVAAAAPGKKLVYYGWGLPETSWIREHWREMDEAPFDGTGITIAIDRAAWARGATKTPNRLGWRVMGRQEFRPADFATAIGELQSARWERLRENFLDVILSPGVSAEGLDWLDEARWEVIVRNVATVAAIARQGGLRGIVLDPEHYDYELFRYGAQRRRLDKPFAVYEAAARRRGQAVMAAIARELPSAVVIALHGNTLPLRQVRKGMSLEEAKYGLYPAFFDGLIEAAPPSVRLVDGYESSYGAKSKDTFLEGRRVIREDAAALSAVRDLYRQTVEAGFAIWLDYGKDPTFYQPAVLRRTIADALDATDGYVWVFSIGPRFFPQRDVSPEMVEAIRGARGAQ